MIFVIGDVILDKYCFGAVDRISPEAPIPVLTRSHHEYRPGGAANVAYNLAKLELDTVLIGLVGQDDAFRDLTETVSDEPKLTFLPLIDNSRRTTCKTRFVSGAQQIMRLDDEVSRPVSPSFWPLLEKALSSHLDKIEMIVLSDYDKGFLSEPMLRNIIEFALKHQITTIVDPKKANLSAYAGVTILKPNLKEFFTLFNTGLNDEGIHQALKNYHIKNLVVTQSSEGISWYSDQKKYHQKASAEHVVDVSGAGDTVTAALVLGVKQKLSIQERLKLANTAASLVVKKQGTAFVTRDELYTRDIHEKVLSLSKIKEQVATWRAKGLSIGFTNGCFDLIHPGHLDLLKKAKAQVDRLIVGLNTDASVKRLKGEHRPIKNEVSRALVLASLSFVDGVILFNEDTPLTLISTLMPDVLIKGADYTLKQVVGADIVAGYGGRVSLIELVPGESSSLLIQKASQSTC